MHVKDAGELYGVPLEEFVAERKALASALRSSGHRDEAARVAKLAKPSVAAWTVNQLVRTQRRAIDALFAAGDALVAAQSELLAGRGDASALRGAGRREREARARLIEIARGLLSSEGHEPTAGTLERVSETLQAAALDADARFRLRDGCLLRELRHVGLGGEMVAATAAPPARKSASPRRASSASGSGAAGSQAPARPAAVGQPTVEERRARAERARELKLAQRAVADADRFEQRAARELQTARERLERAQASLHSAESQVAAAQAHADEAARAHRRARDALESL
jgi:hypothetical protein